MFPVVYRFLFPSFFLMALFLLSCNGPAKEKADKTSAKEGHYGVEFPEENVLDAAGLITGLLRENPLQACFRSTITRSCQHSGCWMELDLGDGLSIRVTFAEGAFTVPVDIQGKTATLKGSASMIIIPVEEKRLQLIEDGATQAEAEAITTPDLKYEFEAEGVIIR